MPSYIPPKKNTQFIFYVALQSQSNGNIMQSSPTIAAGDFKVSIDGGALANLATLPAVTPASSKMVKITLSTSEMNGDNITVVCSDASGAEWRDLVINIQTSAQQIDDIATQTLLTTVAGYVDTEVAAIKAKTDNLPASPAATSDIPSAATIAAAVFAVATSGLTAAGTIGKLLVDNINATISSRLASASYTAPDNTSITAIKAKTDNLPASPAATGDIPSATTVAAAVWDRLTSALTTANSIGKLLVDNVNATISSRLASASYTAPDNTSITAIKAKTDNLPASPAATGDIPTATAIADEVLGDPLVEPAGALSWSGTVRDGLNWLLALSRNRMTQTDTTSTLRNDADSADIATATISDDGTTFTREEWS